MTQNWPEITELALDKFPMALALVDTAGRIQKANTRLCDMFGLSTIAICGTALGGFIDAAGVALEAAQMQDSKFSASQTIKTFAIRHQDGTPRWIRVSEIDGLTVATGDIRLVAIEDITASKQATNELRASDAALKAITQGVLITDEKGVLLSVNDAFSKITGYGANEIIGKTCSFLHGAKTSRATVEKIREARLRGIAFSCEILNYRKNGSTFWNNLTISPVPDESGEITRFVGIARDVTERRKHQKEQRIAAVAFQSREGIMITDREQVILRVNKAFTEITGYSESEVVGKTPKVLSSGKQGVEFYEEIAQTLKQCGVWTGEIWNRRKDGSEYLEWLVITAVKDESDEITHYVGAFTDITLKKRLEQSLHQKERRLSDAQRVGKMGSWEFDYQEDRLEWSDELYRIFEIEKTDFGANYASFLNIVHPEDQFDVDRQYQESVRDHKPVSITHRLLMPDSRIKFIHEQGETFYDEKGIPLRSIGTAQDVTERKLAEYELDIAAIAFESNQAIMISDADRVIMRVNRAFTEITGFETDEAVGQKPSRLLGAARHGSDYFAEITRSIVEDGYWQGELWNRRKDGSEYPIWLHTTAIRSEHGKTTHHVSTFIDISDRKRAEERIHQLAFYDGLTALPNRTFVLESIREVLDQSERNQELGALLFIDLDNFKSINETLGHEIGDLLLQEMASRIVRIAGNQNIVARVGGDEFAVVLRSLGNLQPRAKAKAELIARRILMHMGRQCNINQYSCQCTVSIGVTLIGTEGADSVESILKRADVAMFHAKSDGRNGVRYFQQEMHEKVSARVTLEAELRDALEHERFRLFYQAQVDNEGKVVGAEALIRHLHPEKGIVSPGDFIELAEDIGLMVPIGDWVIETACSQLAIWAQSSQTEQLTLAINVSSMQFRKVDFVAKIQRVLRKSGANPQRLKLELTETLVLADVDQTIEQMKALSELGITFCLDDFGTGYSSLAYLRKLPIHHLKIDKSFVQDIPDESASTIVHTILALARSLNLGVIAEGVENATQHSVLRDAGCDLYQGFHFGRPLPITEFSALIHS